MDRYLVKYTKAFPKEGNFQINRLIDTYPSQRPAALRAKTILLAEEAGKASLANIDNILSSLPEGEKGYLTQTGIIRKLAHEISQHQLRLDAQNRPYLKRETAQGLVGLIDTFSNRIGGLDEPLVSEFRKAAENWRLLAQKQLDVAKELVEKEPAAQVFQAGRAVDPGSEAFVPRFSVLEKLEQHASMPAGSPGIVLYGRRRMGKSTTLRNLTYFLPKSVFPIFMSMQDPRLFSSQRSFLSQLSTVIANPLRQPHLGKSSRDGKPLIDINSLSEFISFLDSTNRDLPKLGTKVLLSIDEYEKIDQKIDEGILSLDLLDTIRESIQKHHNIIWLLAGSHRITELKANWTSYLVSARTVTMPPFSMEETRLLLTEPLSYTKTHGEPVTFEPGFWGPEGIKFIQEETQGWPHFVQLIAQTTIDLLNESSETKVTPELLEKAMQQSARDAETTLSELMKGESKLDGEWEYIWNFRKNEIQHPPENFDIASSLRNRELVVEEGGNWRLRVPFMRRWLLMQ